MSTQLSIACLQYTSTKDEIKTLETINNLIIKAIKLGAEFIALPECATSLQENSNVQDNLHRLKKKA